MKNVNQSARRHSAHRISIIIREILCLRSGRKCLYSVCVPVLFTTTSNRIAIRTIQSMCSRFFFFECVERWCHRRRRWRWWRPIHTCFLPMRFHPWMDTWANARLCADSSCRTHSQTHTGNIRNSVWFLLSLSVRYWNNHFMVKPKRTVKRAQKAWRCVHARRPGREGGGDRRTHTHTHTCAQRLRHPSEKQLEHEIVISSGSGSSSTSQNITYSRTRSHSHSDF